jgi:hypothetical protein
VENFLETLVGCINIILLIISTKDFLISLKEIMKFNILDLSEVSENQDFIDRVMRTGATALYFIITKEILKL